jgi:hypothetical protein
MKKLSLHQSILEQYGIQSNKSTLHLIYALNHHSIAYKTKRLLHKGVNIKV